MEIFNNFGGRFLDIPKADKLTVGIQAFWVSEFMSSGSGLILNYRQQQTVEYKLTIFSIKTFARFDFCL